MRKNPTAKKGKNQMSNDGRNNGAAMVFAFFTGFLTGAVLSLLYAPTSGRETRQKIRDTSIEAKDKTLEFAQQATVTAKEGVQNLVEHGKESVHEFVEVGKERVKDATNQAKTAVETGKQTFSDVRTKIAENIPGVGGNQDAAEEAPEEASEEA